MKAKEEIQLSSKFLLRFFDRALRQASLSASDLSLCRFIFMHFCLSLIHLSGVSAVVFLYFGIIPKCRTTTAGAISVCVCVYTPV